MQADTSVSLSKVCEERDFLRSLNEQLLSNQKALRSAAEEAKRELSGRDDAIKELQEQVCKAKVKNKRVALPTLAMLGTMGQSMSNHLLICHYPSLAAS